MNERLMVAGAAGATIAALAWFGSRPRMKVRVGGRVTGEEVPIHYQLVAFPAFGALAARALVDARRGSWGSAALVATSSLVATARLGGGLPVSGHAFFLGAALAHGLTRGHAPGLVGIAGSGLLLTLGYKARWRDLPAGLAAAGGGAVLGLVTA